MRFRKRIKEFCEGNRKLQEYYRAQRMDKEDIFIHVFFRRIFKR